MGSFRNIINSLRSDFKESDIRSNLSKSIERLKDQFLTRAEQDHLKYSNLFKRWFLTVLWLLGALYKNLDPFRRVLLILGLFLMLFTEVQIGGNVSIGGLHFIGSFLLVLVILLEVMDKMLARSELREGRSIQLSLQPEEKPNIKGWDVLLYSEPANTVGGDLLDFQEIRKDNYGITVGDVAGKGVRAALMMGKLQTIIHAVSLEGSGLHEAVKKINTIFRSESIPAVFASGFFLRLNEQNTEIECVNAGHLPPIIVNHNGIKEFSKGGAALGILPDADYSRMECNVQPGEMIIIFTDGITEAENDYGNFYSHKRLLSLLDQCRGLSAEETGKKILSDIFQFCGDAEQHDDITFAVIKKL